MLVLRLKVLSEPLFFPRKVTGPIAHSKNLTYNTGYASIEKVSKLPILVLPSKNQ